MSKKTTRPRRTLPVGTGSAGRPQTARIAPLLHGPSKEQTLTAHEALTFAPYWDNLRLDGFGPASALQALELRRCPQCGSTISRLIPLTLVEARLAEASDVITRSRKAMSLDHGNVSRSPDGTSGCHGR